MTSRDSKDKCNENSERERQLVLFISSANHSLLPYYLNNRSPLLRHVDISQQSASRVCGVQNRRFKHSSNDALEADVSTHLNAIDLGRDRIRNLGHRRAALYQLGQPGRHDDDDYDDDDDDEEKGV
ncbi:hypothetical protein ANN_06496 [Periplaneta americana]|uniref:Uncharacterized protein n=1 Tax=Periplaneta americana TaxID=6978 RepID=A0ABQ8TDV5_PERAM|nr:hypothetical protein ANN_06496 [Periplaneta americana]